MSYLNTVRSFFTKTTLTLFTAVASICALVGAIPDSPFSGSPLKLMTDVFENLGWADGTTAAAGLSMWFDIHAALTGLIAVSVLGFGLVSLHTSRQPASNAPATLWLGIILCAVRWGSAGCLISLLALALVSASALWRFRHDARHLESIAGVVLLPVFPVISAVSALLGMLDPRVSLGQGKTKES